MNQTTFGGKSGKDRVFQHAQLAKSRDDEVHSILEVGCSVGHTTCDIAQRFNCDIIGIDISEILVAKALEKKEKLGLDNVDFEVADAQNLPFEDNSFDYVIAQALAALMPRKVDLFKEFLRVLKPGGKVVTLDLFCKEGVPDDIKAEIDTTMTGALGYQIEVLSLLEWKNIFTAAKFAAYEVHDYYDHIFERTMPLRDSIPATGRLFYHYCTNKGVRETVAPVMKLAPKMMAKNSPLRQNVGYLIFVGNKKP